MSSSRLSSSCRREARALVGAPLRGSRSRVAATRPSRRRWRSPRLLWSAIREGCRTSTESRTVWRHSLRAARGVISTRRSAAGRIVFTSDRNGNFEIYFADISATVSRQVTNNTAEDSHPALSPDGSTIVFVSNRSGAPRLWSVPAPALDASAFDAPVALATGSATEIPEGAPPGVRTGQLSPSALRVRAHRRSSRCRRRAATRWS